MVEPLSRNHDSIGGVQSMLTAREFVDHLDGDVATPPIYGLTAEQVQAASP